MLTKAMCRAMGFNPDNKEEFSRWYRTSWVREDLK